jgi:hypothetical protein
MEGQIRPYVYSFPSLLAYIPGQRSLISHYSVRNSSLDVISLWMNPPSPPMQDACYVSPLPLPRSLSWQDLLGAFLMIPRAREYSNNNKNNNNTCPHATISPIGRKKWYNLSNWLEEQL